MNKSNTTLSPFATRNALTKREWLTGGAEKNKQQESQSTNKRVTFHKDAVNTSKLHTLEVNYNIKTLPKNKADIVAMVNRKTQSHEKIFQENDVILIKSIDGYCFTAIMFRVDKNHIVANNFLKNEQDNINKVTFNLENGTEDTINFSELQQGRVKYQNGGTTVTSVKDQLKAIISWGNNSTKPDSILDSAKVTGAKKEECIIL